MAEDKGDFLQTQGENPLILNRTNPSIKVEAFIADFPNKVSKFEHIDSLPTIEEAKAKIYGSYSCSSPKRR